MKKLSDLKLDDWKEIAAAHGIEVGDQTTNELIAEIAGKLGVTDGGDDKEGRKERKKAVYAALVAAEEAEGGEAAGGEGGESGDAGEAADPMAKLMALSIEELTQIASQESINISAYTEKEDIANMIHSMRALRNKNIEESKSKPNMSRQISTKGSNKAAAKEIDPAQSFAALCKNVCASFTSGIYGRRQPTTAEIAAHLEKSNHGFNAMEIVEKTETEGKGENKVTRKYVVLKNKIGKNTLTSDKIYVQA